MAFVPRYAKRLSCGLVVTVDDGNCIMLIGGQVTIANVDELTNTLQYAKQIQHAIDTQLPDVEIIAGAWGFDRADAEGRVA